MLVDLLKLAVAGRAGEWGRSTLSKVLTALAKIHSQVKIHIQIYSEKYAICTV